MKTNYIEPEGFKGTPGQWKAKRKQVCSIAESIPNDIVCFPPPDESASLEYWEANALLIAHAKDLLAAAQKAIGLLNNQQWHTCVEAQQALATAINAALGINE